MFFKVKANARNVRERKRPQRGGAGLLVGNRDCSLEASDRVVQLTSITKRRPEIDPDWRLNLKLAQPFT
jgi:hypothetical protein